MENNSGDNTHADTSNRTMDRDKWICDVQAMYRQILEDLIDEKNTLPLNTTIMLDIDETILYNTIYKIPGSIDFVRALHDNFCVVIVSGRIDKGNRRRETVANLQGYSYNYLILRPDCESHKDFKLRIKNSLMPAISIGDQKYDFPDYLIPNPFYYIDEIGDEIMLE